MNQLVNKSFSFTLPHHPAMASATTINSVAQPALFTPLQTEKWELGVSLILNFWQPLRDAVACGWGGPDSSDKRDWLCGVIADLWSEDPDANEDTIEYRLLQVMEDEFEVNLEDDSAFEVCRPARVRS
jgi:pre-rRNA-processing protein TSR2